MFRGRFGSRVGIFLDGSPDTSSKRKRSAPASLMLERDEWAMTDKEIRQEERFRRMRRIYCRRGSVRRASTTQLTSGEHVSVDSPPSIADDDSMQKQSRSVTPRMRRKGSAPASLNLYLMDQDEEDQINRSSPFERLSRAWASDGAGSRGTGRHLPGRAVAIGGASPFLQF